MATATYAIGPTAADPATTMLNCDHGDPTMFESYWDYAGVEHEHLTRANDRMSYFVENKGYNTAGIWFVHADLDDAVRDLHDLVGNAIVKDRFVIVGTGSTNLFLAAVYSLSNPEEASPTPVIAAAPYYSAYPAQVDFLRSGLFKWGGDARTFSRKSEDDAYIEVVTSPNNPDGTIREALKVNASGRSVIHDLAYYWPTFTPITGAKDHDVMLFTLSKCTGHAGSRIGWAIVKSPQVAQKMAKFIEMTTIGVSQDSQIRATIMIRAVLSGYKQSSLSGPPYENLTVDSGDSASSVNGLTKKKLFFHFGKEVMEARWKAVRSALHGNAKFTIPDFSSPAYCTFTGTTYFTNPAFLWLKSEEEEDCRKALLRAGVLARGGEAFGVSAQYCRVSLVDRQPAVDALIERLASLQ